MTNPATYTEADLHDRLRKFEAEYGMDSENFLTEWEADRLPHTDELFVWAGLCSRLGVRVREFAG